jgi:hypothetical protein
MTICSWYEGHWECVEHLRELRAEAERERLARQLRVPHPVRRSIGALLIACGQALAGHRSEPSVELVAQPSSSVWGRYRSS